MRLLVLLGGILYYGTSIAQTEVLRLARQPQWVEPFDLTSFTFYYEVPDDHDPPFEDVQLKAFQPFSTKSNKRIEGNTNTTDITWLRFTLANTGSDTIHVLYNCNVHSLVTVYMDGKMLSRKGFTLGNEDHAPIEILPGQTNTYWVKVEDILAAVVPMTSELHTETTRLSVRSRQLHDLFPLIILMSLWCGCFIFMSAYSMYRFYLNRDRVFLYYSIFSFMLFWTCMFALGSRIGLFFIPHAFAFFLFISYGFFIARIIDLRQNSPRAWMALKVFMGALFLFELISLTERYVTHGPLFSIIAYYDYQLAANLLVVAFCLLQVLISRSPIKKFLAAGITSMLAVGLVPMILNPYFIVGDSRWEPMINYPYTFAFAGFVVENFCFAMALAYRSRLVELEKESLQKNYSHQLEKDLAERAAEIQAKIKEVEEAKIRQLTISYEQRLLQMETTALRAQMNPHFIFNCLNSIKLYTLDNDSTGAAGYLTKFSRLIRLVLENSQAEKIPLSVELETLQLYVDMESMRFKNRFTFNVRTDDAIDPEYIDIPPLLLQPYVENAIWHGLMQKEESGQVALTFELSDGHTLRVEICDDGIGRAKAAEYRSKSATRHKSFGMKVNSERIALMNQQSKKDAAVMIEDLVTADGRAAGTKVILIIPV